MPLSFIVAGATGAIGREAVVAAVAEHQAGRVVALSRRSIEESHWLDSFPGLDLALAKNKLEVVAVDWESLHRDGLQTQPASVVAAFAGHEAALMCMGTTRRDAGSDEAFRRCDLDYVVAFAAAVKQGSPSLRHYAQMSSRGADAKSYFLYMRTKGEADQMATDQSFPSTSLFRPGLLGRKEKARFVEKFFGVFVSAIPVDVVGRALVKWSTRCCSAPANPSVSIFGNKDIARIADEPL